MSFDRDKLRKGSAAIEEALASRNRGDGEFRSFLPNLYFKNDGDFRYLMFLNSLEEIPEVDFHPYIDCDDGVPHMCFARTDRAIGESADPIQQRWGYKPRLSGLAIAVELEPIEKVVGKFTKPVGFEVKVNTFERRIRDEEGELTDEREEVSAPVVGLVVQSPYNFYNQLKIIDSTEAAIHSAPLKVTRVGQKEGVTYSIKAYDDIKPDLSGLFENLMNLSYIRPDDRESLQALLDKTDDEEQKILIIGDYLLYRRLDELADETEYNEILGKITKPAKFQDNKKEDKAERKARPSQRRAKQEPVEEDVNKDSPATERLERLRSLASKK